MPGVPLGRQYEGCWKALCLFTEAQEQILCTFQGRSVPGWLPLPQMLQSYLTIHPYCLYASPFAAPSFPPSTKAAPLEPELFVVQIKRPSVLEHPSEIPVGLAVLTHSLYYWWKWISLYLLASRFGFSALHHISKGLSDCIWLEITGAPILLLNYGLLSL